MTRFRGIKIDVKGLGREFSVAVEPQLERIALSPNQFAYVRGDVRRAVLQRFPYSIYISSSKKSGL
jgi:hypothetical protein